MDAREPQEIGQIGGRRTLQEGSLKEGIATIVGELEKQRKTVSSSKK